MTEADIAAKRQIGNTDDVLDNAEAYIPGDRRRALAAGTAMPDRVRGSALFADISGFTPLTEALANELGPQRGAEELTAHLNRVYHALVADLERYAGHVIYFSGDAITCWLDGDDGARATACALAMQATTGRLADVRTPAGVSMPLAMKVSVAVGAARRFMVGDPDIQRIDVLAGRLVDAIASAERRAERGEVVLDQSALDALGERVRLREIRIDKQSGRRYGVVERLAEAVAVADAPATAHVELPEKTVREWLLPEVYERLRTGRGEFLAELRPAYPLFLRFGGIDYDHDDDAIDKLDALIRRAQQIMAAYGGNLLHLALGDKGAYMYGVFGSPSAHEDDAARASAAALELRELPATTAVTDIQIGITYGRLRSGTYGHKRRQTFTCLGDAVNLAARLMAKAPSGQIYVSEPVRRAAGEVFTWEELSPISVKGKAEPVAAYVLHESKRRATRGRQSYELPLVGRRAELDTLESNLGEALAGRGQMVGVSAEAGMGKSRLVAEFARTAAERVVVAVGECQSYGTNIAYFVWRDIWSTLLRIDGSLPEDERVKALHAELAAIDPALVPRAPLLSVLLDLPLPDNELTAQFDGKLRKTSLEGLLARCLEARAAEGPVLLVLEDCHWLDALSRDLLEVLARALAGLRVLLLLAYRPSGKAGGKLAIEHLPHFHDMSLAELDAAEASQLIRKKLAQLIGDDAEPPPALVRLVTTRAQGNPFYIEELLSFIRSQSLDLRDESALARLQLPESLHSLVLSRIDMLGESPRRTLKVASVVGRVFRASTLTGVYAELGGVDDVRGDLRALRTVDIVNVDQEAEETYVFKHFVTQEVAYESMPFAFRSMLHERVGGYIEAVEADAIERHLDLLAHHYWLSGNLPKKREYLRRAGEAAQASYANAAAIDYFERLAPLVEEGARVDALLQLGKVLEVVGQWSRAEKVDNEAMAIAADLGDGLAHAACETALAEVARKQGRYDEVVARLARAASRYGELGDEKGVGRVLHLAGTVAAQRGDYAKAIDNYEASLAIREKLGDKASMGSLLSNLGVIAEYRGEYDRSNQLHERALALRTEIGDRRDIANSMNCLGMVAVLQRRYAEARAWFEKSILLNREVGDSWMVAICHNNLGNATRGLGDYDAARKHYADSLRAYRDYDDRWALAFLLEDIAILAALCKDAPKALELLGAAEALREAIGAPRAPSLVTEIDEQLAAAGVALSAGERDAARDRGKDFDAAAAVERALELCERPTAVQSNGM